MYSGKIAVPPGGGGIRINLNKQQRFEELASCRVTQLTPRGCEDRMF
jgi:hypothetical protein